MGGLISWFVKNPIAANLLMLLILMGGASSFSRLDKQFFPERELNQIDISVPYLGASPSEVERQVILRIEEAIDGLDGIAEVNSTASEGLGRVSINVIEGFDTLRLLNDVKSRIDALNTLPEEAERPKIREILWRSQTMSIALSGEMSEQELKELGETLREQMLRLPGVDQIDLRDPRAYELSIEVSEFSLRKYGLSFDDISQAVRASSLDLPGGQLRSDSGNLRIQARSQSYTPEQFADIVLIQNRDGGQLRLGDIATVSNGFEERDSYASFNGKRALSLEIYSTQNPDVVEVSESLTAFVENTRPTLPANTELVITMDMADPFEGRLNTLANNGIGGLALVFIVLLLFLRPLLAFWVCVGIAVAFFGAFWLLAFTGVSLNMVSLFAFILILGIVVDDAIIVGESIFSHQENSNSPLSSSSSINDAINGAQNVMKPVWFAVISTMLFFVPFFFMPEEAPEPPTLATVVVIALSFSLIESMFILPSHLAHMPPEREARLAPLKKLNQLRTVLAAGLQRFAVERYQPFLHQCLDWKGTTVISFAIGFLIILSIVMGGWMRFFFFPNVPLDNITATIELYEGTAFSESKRIADQVERAAFKLNEELNQGELEFGGDIVTSNRGDLIRVSMSLNNVEERDFPADDIKRRWESLIGELHNIKDLQITYYMSGFGKPIELLIATSSLDDLQDAASRVKAELAQYPGVYNISDSLDTPQQELVIKLTPEGEALGLTVRDIARQVRQGFYGEEIQRIPAKREDVRVMLRYPAAERSSVAHLRSMRIRTADGEQVPFDSVADISLEPSYKTIRRLDGKRMSIVSADLEGGSGGQAIIGKLIAEMGPVLRADYPDISIGIEGREQTQSEFMATTQQLGMLMILVIYGLMAIVFRSYSQPSMIIAAIPFGFMGAIIGHLLFDLEISMFSILGILAVAGVVVNDNLVMVDRINQLRAQGKELRDAIVLGAKDRFRPVILTSVTTFVGLTPIMMETSIQAQFLIPMVVSLAFGILIATPVSLIFVPSFYFWGHHVKARMSNAVKTALAPIGKLSH